MRIHDGNSRCDRSRLFQVVTSGQRLGHSEGRASGVRLPCSLAVGWQGRGHHDNVELLIVVRRGSSYRGPHNKSEVVYRHSHCLSLDRNRIACLTRDSEKIVVAILALQGSL